MRKESAEQYVARIFNEARVEAKERQEAKQLFNFASKLINPKLITEAEQVKRTGRY